MSPEDRVLKRLLAFSSGVSGGALWPTLTGLVSDHVNTHTAYLIPMVRDTGSTRKKSELILRFRSGGIHSSHALRPRDVDYSEQEVYRQDYYLADGRESSRPHLSTDQYLIPSCGSCCRLL
jgi:hypothetical protein